MSQQVLSRKRVKKTKNNLKKSIKKGDGGEREQGQRADQLFSFPSVLVTLHQGRLCGTAGRLRRGLEILASVPHGCLRFS